MDKKKERREERMMKRRKERRKKGKEGTEGLMEEGKVSWSCPPHFLREEQNHVTSIPFSVPDIGQEIG